MTETTWRPSGDVVGLTDRPRLPRLGKIRLGVRALSARGNEYPKAVERRHRSWGDALPTLQAFDSVPAFIDEPKFKDSIRQDIEIVGGRLLYLRFHGRKFDKWWRHEHRSERYDYLYRPEEIEPYAIRLKSILESKDIQRAYIFFNNHPGAKAVANAVIMRAQLDVPVTAELPEKFLETFPEARNVD